MVLEELLSMIVSLTIKVDGLLKATEITNTQEEVPIHLPLKEVADIEAMELLLQDLDKEKIIVSISECSYVEIQYRDSHDLTP